MRQLRQLIVTMLRVSYDYGVSNPGNSTGGSRALAVAEAIARRDGKSARGHMVSMLERNRGLAKVHYRRAAIAMPKG